MKLCVNFSRIDGRRALVSVCIALLAACGGGGNSGNGGDGAIAAKSAIPGEPINPNGKNADEMGAQAGVVADTSAEPTVQKAADVARSPVYRFFNIQTGTHFYTSSAAERDQVIATLARYRFEGIGFYAYTSPQPGTSAVFRFYNLRTGTHFYTVSEPERDHVREALSSTFAYEGPAWYAATTAHVSNTAIYRFYNASTGAHFYTASAQERADVNARFRQFGDEGVGYYVWQNAADPRNGQYRVFSASGARALLKLDFETLRYEMDDGGVDASGSKPSGPILRAASPSDAHSLMTSRNPPGSVSVSTFRQFGDTVVGSFPFAVYGASPSSYASSPFIAVRALVTDPARVDGIFNRFTIETTAAGPESYITQVQVANKGTLLRQCQDIGIYRIDLCPAGSVAESAVELDAEAGSWRILKPDGTLKGRFTMARVADENVLLLGGTLDATTATFSIALPEVADWIAFNSAGGWSTKGSLDITGATTTNYSIYSSIGWPIGASLSLSTMGGAGPRSMRAGTLGADNYFLARSRKLEAMIGSRGTPATMGYLHLGVIND